MPTPRLRPRRSSSRARRRRPPARPPRPRGRSLGRRRDAASAIRRSFPSSLASRSSAVPLQRASRQPRLGQVPGQRRAVRLDRRRGRARRRGPSRPRKIAAVDHDPAADAGAEREHHEVRARPRSSASASAAQFASLSTKTGTPSRRELLAQRDALERDVHARHHGARWRSRSGSARRPRPPRALVAHLAEPPPRSRPSRASPLEVSVGCSTTLPRLGPGHRAAAIFVPPTSTPTTSGSELTGHSFPGASPRCNRPRYAPERWSAASLPPTSAVRALRWSATSAACTSRATRARAPASGSAAASS